MANRRRISRLTFILTTRCNMSCSYCYQRVREPRRMEWPVAKAAADLVLSMGGEKVELTFYGGEPLLEFGLMKRIVEHVEAAREPEQRVRYWVVTNGTLFTDEVTDYLAARGITILLSFDGVPEAQRIRGEGTFETLDAALDRLRERHPDHFRRAVEISVTVPPEAVPFLADSIEYLYGKGVARINLNPVVTHAPEWSDERLAELEAQFDRILGGSIAYLERTGDVPLETYSGEGLSVDQSVTSRAMCEVVDSNSWAVDVDGTVSGCTLFAPSVQAYGSELLRGCRSVMEVGSVRDPGIRDRMAAFGGVVGALPIMSEKEKKYSSYRSCVDCRFFAACVTCPVSIGFAEGNTDPHRVPDYYCAFIYTSLASRDGFPVQPTDLEVIRGDRYSELREKWRHMAGEERREA
jgi:sulfatase maturation enzyme AslB (radical SAM superfamily)